MARTKTSKAWMCEHLNDPYVQRAKAEGWRSRAAFKLMEVDDRDHLLRPGLAVVDLGCAPGSWSQVAVQRTQPGGVVVGLDLLEVAPLHRMHFIQGDFREEAVLQQLERQLDGRPVGLVLSDMAPNMSGVPLVDQARVMHLAELTLEFALNHLSPDGAMLVKVFQGVGYEDYVRDLRAAFAVVATRKPLASRGRSAETFLLARNPKARARTGAAARE